jgi:hypothetical protein
MSISQISSLFILFDTYILLDPHASKSQNEKGIKWLAKSESSIWSLKRSQYDPLPLYFCLAFKCYTHFIVHFQLYNHNRQIQQRSLYIWWIIIPTHFPIYVPKWKHLIFFQTISILVSICHSLVEQHKKTHTMLGDTSLLT